MKEICQYDNNIFNLKYNNKLNDSNFVFDNVNDEFEKENEYFAFKKNEKINKKIITKFEKVLKKEIK